MTHSSRLTLTCLPQVYFEMPQKSTSETSVTQYFLWHDVLNTFAPLSIFRINLLLTLLSCGVLQQLSCWYLSHFSLLIAARENFLRNRSLRLNPSNGLSEDCKIPGGKDGVPGTSLSVASEISDLTNVLSPRSGISFISESHAYTEQDGGSLHRVQFETSSPFFYYLLQFRGIFPKMFEDTELVFWVKYLLQDTHSSDGYITL